MATLIELQQGIDAAMRRGRSFSSVEDDIDALDLTDREKSALWLFGWSFVNLRAQRREATALIAWLESEAGPQSAAA